MPKTVAAPTMYKVPPGTKSTPCRGSTCGRRFYWIRDAHGNPKPISCDVEGGKHPSESKDVGQLDLMGGEAEVYEGFGVLHHSVCPDVDEFKRRDH